MASGFPESVPAWYTGPSGASAAMTSARPPNGADGQAATDHLAEAGQVGPDAVAALGAARPEAEAGDDLVEDQERARPVARRAQAREEAGLPGGPAPMLAATGSTMTQATSSPTSGTTL